MEIDADMECAFGSVCTYADEERLATGGECLPTPMKETLLRLSRSP